MSRRTIGIVRVSESKGREGESFASPADQHARMREACKRDGLDLISVSEEIDVSGGTPLARREGLRGAVEAVEDGRADVVMVAYFDRLVRSLRVQDEVVSRVEAAGGRVVAIDFGEVTGRTAAQWLSGTMIGAVSEYYRRSIGERSGEAQARAVARGVPPWANIPPGYRRGPTGVLVPNAEQAIAVRRAFERRVEGATIKDIRADLRSAGIERSFHGVGHMLSSRVYLGEIHFGELVNLEAHEAIIERGLWEAVQRVKIPRGRRPHSDRILARLGVLRCGTCGARMSVGMQTQNGRRYPFYRCNPSSDCPRRMAISAEIAERVVVAAVRRELADVEGRASAERSAREAVATAERTQAELDAAIRAFSGLDDEPAAREKLADLRSTRDVAREEAHRLGGLHSSLTVNISERWEDLTLEEQRGFIRDIVSRAVVAPGKGAGRITVHLFREQTAGD